MTDANEVLQTLCEKYQAAVSANDSVAYGKLFAKTWLLHKEDSGDWLMKRQMWNCK